MMNFNCPIFTEDDVNTVKDFLSAKREYDRANLTIKLNQAKRRLKDKEQVISDLQNEYELLEKQAFEIYKHEISYFGFDYVPGGLLLINSTTGRFQMILSVIVIQEESNVVLEFSPYTEWLLETQITKRSITDIMMQKTN